MILLSRLSGWLALARICAYLSRGIDSSAGGFLRERMRTPPAS